jgi:hypothetical protein
VSRSSLFLVDSQSRNSARARCRPLEFEDVIEELHKVTLLLVLLRLERH